MAGRCADMWIVDQGTHAARVARHNHDAVFEVDGCELGSAELCSIKVEGACPRDDAARQVARGVGAGPPVGP